MSAAHRFSLLAVLMLALFAFTAPAILATSAPVNSTPVPARLSRRALRAPLSVSAAGSRVQWCCKERGLCKSTQCERTKSYYGVYLYGNKYRTEDDCILARCRQVCFKTTRSCDTFF